MNNNANDELTFKLINKLMENFQNLETDMELQLKVKHSLEEIIYDYQILPITKELMVSDMNEKIDYFLACRKLKGLASKTIDSYDRLLRSFSLAISKPVSQVNAIDIRRYIAPLMSVNGAETINNKIILINQFFQFLQDERIITDNPCSRIDRIKAPKRKRKAIQVEQQELLRNACDTLREKIIFELFISSGIRVSEAIDIKVSDINWQDRSIYVIGKGNKERRVRFSTKCKIELEEYLKERKGNSEYLITSIRFPFEKVSTRCIQKEVKTILNRSKLDINIFPHLFRHSFATNASNDGMSLTSLQHIMGHENLSTTQIYITNSDNTIDMDYNRIIK